MIPSTKRHIVVVVIIIIMIVSEGLLVNHAILFVLLFGLIFLSIVTGQVSSTDEDDPYGISDKEVIFLIAGLFVFFLFLLLIALLVRWNRLKRQKLRDHGNNRNPSSVSSRTSNNNRPPGFIPLGRMLSKHPEEGLPPPAYASLYE